MCSPSVGRSRRAASTSSALTFDGARLRWLAAREREQIRGQAGATGGGLGDQPCDGCKVRAIRDSLLQDFDRAADDGEDVVEVVKQRRRSTDRRSPSAWPVESALPTASAERDF